MKDILGRELKEGDVVVIKGSGGEHGSAKPMAVGIFYKKSVRLPGGAHRSARDMFLVENPGKLEQDIKDTILKELEAEKKAAAVRAQQKNAQKANFVGRVYQMAKENKVFLYLGEKRVQYFVDGELLHDEVGNLYFDCGRTHVYNPIDPTKVDFESAKKRVQEALSSWGSTYYDVVKGFKSYVKEYHDVEVPREFEISGVHTWKTGKWNGVSSQTDMQWEEHVKNIRVVITDVYK